MSVIALQKQLYAKISKIKNKEELEFLNNYIIKSKEAISELEISPEMASLISISEKQLQNGEYKTNDEAMKELDLWIKDIK